MIFYNMRYRGPYEYDKFVLNILQYSNISNDFINDLNNPLTWKTLYSISKEVENLFAQSTDALGKSDKIYRYLIMNRGEYDD